MDGDRWLGMVNKLNGYSDSRKGKGQVVCLVRREINFFFSPCAMGNGMGCHW